MDRISQVSSHLASAPSAGLKELLTSSPNDVVLVLSKRSPLCKAAKGGYKDSTVDELMTAMFKATVKAMPKGMDASMVQDICVGVVQGGANENFARAASLAAGFPVTSPVQTVNRFCSSGLMAVSVIANQIRNFEIDCGLAMGIESLSANATNLEGKLSTEIMAHPVAKDCSMTMGETSENVAGDFNISRIKMDAVAAASHQRAERANDLGLFAQEIIPLEVLQKVAGQAERVPVLVTADDGLRKGTTAESLAKVRPAFPKFPPHQTTGGNASQLTDGAAVVILMRRSKAEALGLEILGKHVATVVSGLAPRIMGIGPTLAIPKILERCNITADEVDLYEINEAFASMYVYCLETLKLDPSKVNVNGGAIALGHPFGCTGARQIATGLTEIRRRKQRVLVTSMCIGAGMGAASVFVAE